MLVAVWVRGGGRWIRCVGFLVRVFEGWVFGRWLWLIGCVLLFMALVIMVEWGLGYCSWFRTNPWLVPNPPNLQPQQCPKSRQQCH